MTRTKAVRLAVVGTVTAAASIAYSVTDSSGTTMSPIDNVTSTMSNPAYLVFVGLTSWLVFSAVEVSTPLEPTHLIRYGTHLSSLIRPAWIATTYAIAFEVVSMVAVATASLTRPTQVPFDGLAGSVGRLFTECVAILVVAFVIRVAIGAVELAAGRLLVTVFACVLLWVWAVASVSDFIDAGPALDFRYYISFDAVATKPAAGLWVVGVLLVVLAVSLGIGKFRDRAARGTGKVSFVSIADFALAPVAVLLGALTLSIGSGSLGAAFQTLLVGPGGTILQSLLAVLLYAGYAFGFQFRVQGKMGAWGALNLLRYGSLTAYLIRVIARECLRATLYVIALILVIGLAYFAVGGRSFGVGPLDTGSLVIQLIPVSIFQLMFYSLLVLIAVTFTSNALGGLIAVGAIAALCFAPVDESLPIPFQRQSLVGLDFNMSLWNLCLTATAAVVTVAALLLAQRLNSSNHGLRF